MADYYNCCRCTKKKPWYRFPLPVKEDKPIICCECFDRNKDLKKQLEIIQLEKRITKMATKMSDLRSDLFDTLRKVKAGELKVAEATSICQIAQVIINSAKVEIDFMKAVNAKSGSGFIEVEDIKQLTN